MVGIGVDIVEIKRIEEAVSKQSKFLARLFTTSERAYFVKKNNRAETIAGFFAAKEAVSKVLGTGIAGFNWQDIEISHTEMGKPMVTLHNQAKAIAEKQSIDKILISISHCKTYAVANAVGI